MEKQSPFASAHLWVMVALLLLLTALAAPALNEAIWTDEQRTLWYAGAAPEYGPTHLTESITRVADNYWQAPAYFLSVWGWGRAVGWSVFALRSFSLLIGILAVTMLYRAGRDLFGESVGLYAALIFGLSAFFLNFLHDMRAYTLLLLLTSAALWTYHRATQGNRWAVIGFGVSITVAIYTHYFMGFLAAGLGISHLMWGRKKAHFIPLLVAFVIAGGLFLPWANVFVEGARLSSAEGQRTDNMSVLLALQTIFRMMSNANVGLGVTLVLIGISRKLSEEERHLWTWIIAALAIALGATRVFRILNEVRYLIFVFPALALLAAIGVNRMRTIRGIPILIMLGWTLGFVNAQLDADFQFDVYPWTTPPFDEMVGAIDGQTTDDDMFMFIMHPKPDFVSLADVLTHYLYGVPLSHSVIIQDTYATTDTAYAEQVIGTLGDSERLWLTYETWRRHWRVGPVTEQTLPQQGYTHCGTAHQTDSATVELYVRYDASADNAIFSNSDHEAAVYLTAPPARINDQLIIAPAWHVERGVVHSHSVGFYISDEAGQVLATHDIGISTPDFSCGYLTFDATTWPDTLTVSALVYDWQTLEPLPAEGANPTYGYVMLAELP